MDRLLSELTDWLIHNRAISSDDKELYEYAIYSFSSEQKVQLQRVIIALTRIARLQRVIHIFAVKIIL